MPVRFTHQVAFCSPYVIEHSPSFQDRFDLRPSTAFWASSSSQGLFWYAGLLSAILTNAAVELNRQRVIHDDIPRVGAHLNCYASISIRRVYIFLFQICQYILIFCLFLFSKCDLTYLTSVQVQISSTTDFIFNLSLLLKKDLPFLFLSVRHISLSWSSREI